MTKTKAIVFALLGSTFLGGCTTSIAHLETVKNNPKEAPIIYSSPVRSNVTPMSEPLACFGKKLKAQRKSPISVAVGDVKDYTGKQGQDEGYAITQGGALMAYTALGKMHGGVLLHERFDTRIAEAELVYGDRRQLGDGAQHQVPDPKTGQGTEVPWKPYFGGSIRQSQYFIVGGITELNYNIQSGGAEFAVSNVGPKARIFTMNIAVDLRIVGTQSLLVYDTVSLQKQISGYEVGVGVFRFFGSNLFDVNVGAKNQEPLQLGVRTAIEAAVMELVGSVANVDPTTCMPESLGPVKWNGADPAVKQAAAEAARDQDAYDTSEMLAAADEKLVLPPPASPEPKVQTAAVKPVQSQEKTASNQSNEVAVEFQPDSVNLNKMSLATLDHVASLVSGGRQVNLTVSTRDTKTGSNANPTLVRQRIDAVVAALAERGISKNEAKLAWQASSTQVSMTSTSGIQEIARMRVG
jgi:curli biogenesis system outer membrane secretion channel CsgG/outer membrane protein OmpA-like peptidoglycan-associated protein